MLIDWDSLKSKREKAVKELSVHQTTTKVEKLSDRFQNPTFRRLALANENGINLSAGDISAYYNDLDGINRYLNGGKYSAEGHAGIAQKAKENALALSNQMAEMQKAGYTTDSAVYTNAKRLEEYYAKLNNTLSAKNSVEDMTEQYLNNSANQLLRLKSNTPSYQETQKELDRLARARGFYDHNGKDTSAYDRAIEMLKGYANNFGFNDNTSAADRQSIYNAKQRRILELDAKETSPRGSTNLSGRDRALAQWYARYYNNEILSDAENVDAILNVQNDTGYDLMGELNGLNEEQRKQKAEQIQSELASKYNFWEIGQDGNYDLRFISDEQQAKDRKERKQLENELKLYKRDYGEDFYNGRINYNDPNFDTLSKPPVYKDESGESKEENMDKLTLYLYMKRDDSRLLNLEDPVGKVRLNGSEYNEYGEDLATHSGSPAKYLPRGKGAAYNSNLMNILTEGDDQQWGYLDQYQREKYYYLLNTEGREAAYQFLSDLASALQKENTQYLQNRAEMINELVREKYGDFFGGIINSGASIGLKVLGSPSSFTDDTVRFFSGEGQAPYNSAHALSNISDAVVQEEASYIDKISGGWNIGGFSAGDLYQAGVSTVEFTAGALLSPKAYALFMSMDAARLTAKDVYDRGGTPAQIFIESTAAGAFEYLFERASLEVITNKIIANLSKVEGKGKKFLAGIISGILSAGTEGSEEVFTEAANYIADILIMRDRSERQLLIKNYLDQGYSQEEAEKRANEEFAQSLWEAFAGGFVSGGLGSTGVYALSAGANAYDKAQGAIDTHKYIKENTSNIAGTKGGADAVMKAAQEIIADESITGKEALQKAVNKVAAMSVDDKGYNKAVARVAAEFENIQKGEYRGSYSRALNSVISDTITELAPDGADISVLEGITRKEYNSEELTKAEQKVYADSAVREAVDKAVDELKSDAGSEKIAEATIKNAQTAVDKIRETRVKSGVTKVDTEYNDTFSVADTGENLVNDKPVTVQKFTNVSSDDMTVQLDDGTQVKASDISWGDSNLPAVFGSVLRLQKTYGVSFTPAFVNTVYQAYQAEKSARSIQDKGFRGDVFAWGLEQAFDDGYVGKDYHGDILSSEAAKMITDAAHKMREENSAKADAERKQEAKKAKKEGKQAREGSVTADNSVAKDQDGGIDKSKLNPKQKVSVEVVERLAKALRADFVLFRSRYVDGKWVSQYSKKGENSPNGFYKDGKIYVDLNAGINGEGLMLFTVSHELVHFMRDGSKQSFDRLADFLVKNYGTRGTTLAQYIAGEMSKGVSKDVAYEEVVARLCESFLTDIHMSEKVEALYKTDRSLCEKIRDFLRDIGQKIKAAFAGAKPQSELGRIGRDIAQKHSEVLDLFIEGIRKASENLAYAKNTTGEGGVRHDNRLTEDDLQDYLKAGKRQNKGKIAALNEGKKIILVSEGDIKSYIAKSISGSSDIASTAAYGRVAERLANDVYDYSEGGIDIKGNYLELVSSDIKHSFKEHHIAKQEGDIDLSQKDYERVTEYLDSYDELIYAIRFHSGNTRVVVGKTTPNGKLVIIEAVSTSRGSLEFKNMIGMTESKYAEFVAPYKKRNSSNARGSYSSNISLRDDTVSINSILDYSAKSNTFEEKRLEQSRDADYLSAVEHGDMETAQRMVDEAAKAAGYTIKAYHGTENDFTVFEQGHKRRSGKKYPTGKSLGEGHYFAPSKASAEMHIEKGKVISSYLSMSNPYIKYFGYGFSKSDLQELSEKAGYTVDRFNVHEYLQSEGYDGIINRDYFTSKDEQYVVYDSSQVKSADPVTYDDKGNVIPLSARFNPEQKDIRYDSRDMGDWFDDDDAFLSEDDEIQDVFARHYLTHAEAIGEVLKNTADIEIAPGTVKNIVSRVLRENLGNVDNDTKRDLALRIQIELENAKNADPEKIVDNMIAAVRKVIQDMKIENAEAVEQYDELKAAFNGKYYLTDEQLDDLKENDYTLGRLRRELMGKVNIVSKDTAKRSINGGYADATELSFEGVADSFTNGNFEQIFGISADEWDQYGYHAPMMLLQAFEELSAAREIELTQRASSEDMDGMAVNLAAKITGAIVQQKYNSRHNPYVSELVDKFEQRKREAVKKRNEYYANQMKKLREQRDKKIAEQIKKSKEQRQSDNERRKRAEVRQRIRKMYNEVETLAKNPKKGKYIPAELLTQSMNVLSAINLDSGFKGARADSFRAKLFQLKETFKNLAEENKEFTQINTAIANMLNEVYELVGDTPLGKMTMWQLQLVHDTLNAVRTNIRNRCKEISDTEVGVENGEFFSVLGDKWIGEIDDAKRRGVFGSKFFTAHLSPRRMLNMISGGAKNNVGLHIYDGINAGQLKRIELRVRFGRMFEELANDPKGVKSLKKPVDIGLVDENGNKVEISRGMMLSLYMHLQNNDNIWHVIGGGLSVPWLKGYYNGNNDKAYGSRKARVRRLNYAYTRSLIDQLKELHTKLDDISLTQEEQSAIWDEIDRVNELYDQEIKKAISDYIVPLKSRIQNMMTEYDKKWIETAQKFFDVECKEELNKTTMALYGFKKAVVEHYFPIHSDRAFLDQKFDALERDLNLENMGSMKSRVHSSNAIYLEDISDVVTRQIDNVSRYCGLVIPLYNAKKIYGFNSHDTSVVEKLAKYDGKATKYIKNLFEDLQDARKTDHEWTDRILAYARHGVAGAALLHNLKIALKQGASYPTAAAEIGYIPLAKALFKMEREDGNRYIIGRAEKELIYKYTPLLAHRSMGYSTQEVGDLKNSKGIVDKVVNRSKYTVFSQTRINEMTGAKKRVATAVNSIASLKWAFGWIQAVDTGTVGRLWYACKYYVDDQYKNLAKGSDEYYKQVAEEFNRVIENTQPNYTVMQRPDILRSTNPVTKMLTMFKTQLMQNFNILYDAAITYGKMRKDYNNGVNSKNGVTLQDKKAAGVRLARSISSQIIAVAAIVGLGFLADAILHRMGSWRDDDEDITGLSVTRRLQYYFNDSLLGTIMGGSELHNLLCSLILKEPWYGFSMNGLDTLDDLVNNLVKAVQSGDGKYIAKTITNLGQTVGAPLANIKKAIGAVALHIEDIKNGKFLSFESGVNRTYQQNLHRCWSAYNMGNRTDAVAIMDAMKEQKIQEYLDRGKNEAEAKKEAYSDLRQKIRDQFRMDYLQARNRYYHGKPGERGKDEDIRTITSITNLMSAAKLYEDPSVNQTLNKWWNDAVESAEEAGVSMTDYLKDKAWRIDVFLGQVWDEVKDISE